MQTREFVEHVRKNFDKFVSAGTYYTFEDVRDVNNYIFRDESLGLWILIQYVKKDHHGRKEKFVLRICNSSERPEFFNSKDWTSIPDRFVKNLKHDFEEYFGFVSDPAMEILKEIKYNEN